MYFRLSMVLIILTILLSIAVIKALLRNKLNLKYSIIWFVFILALLIIAIIPRFVYWFSDAIGISIPSNCVFLIAICFLISMVFSLTIRISYINRKTFDLVQQVALLEKRIQDIKEQEYQAVEEESDTI